MKSKQAGQSGHSKVKDCDIHLSCIMAGDSKVGKTTLLTAYLSNAFSSEYVETLLGCHEGLKVMHRGQQISLDIWDVSGSPSFDRLRPLVMAKMDVVFLCFSLVDLESFWNLKERWMAICKDVPVVVLVGTKMELRDCPTTQARMRNKHSVMPITKTQASHMAKEIGAVGYVECSAFCGPYLEVAVERAVRACLAWINCRQGRGRAL